MAHFVLKRLFLVFVTFWTIHAFGVDHFKAGQTLSPTIPGDPTARDHYGMTVRVSGGFLFVAAPAARPDGKHAEGVVYVYQRDKKDKWALTQTISAGCAADSTGFLDIEVKDNWLFISSGATPIVPVSQHVLGTQDCSGSVKVYRLNRHLEEGSQEWVLMQTLDSNFPGLEDLTGSSHEGLDASLPTTKAEQGASFGMRLSFDLKNRLLLVGAPYQQGLDGDGDPLHNAGAVYAFKMNRHGKFKFLQKITNPEGINAHDTFGANVCVQGHYALISNAAIYKTPRLKNNSKVYVYHFRHHKWSLIQTLKGDQAAPTVVNSPLLGKVKVGDGFGSSLAMYGDWALVGAGLESKPNHPFAGAAYFYKMKQKDNKFLYFRKQKVHSNSNSTYGTALIHVNLRNDTALISDPGRPGAHGSFQGGLLLFKRHGDKWKHESTLVNPKGTKHSFFGLGVDRDKDLIISGTGSYAGSYLFKLLGHPELQKEKPAEKNQVLIFNRK